MSTLEARIAEDAVRAQKERDEQKLAVLRLLKSVIHNEEIAKGRALNDEELIGLIGKEVAKRKEAEALYRQGGRRELAEREGRERAVLETYLPAQASEEEIEQAIQKALAQSGVTEVREMGKVMGIVAKKLAGRAPMGEVAGRIKAKLSR